MAHFSTIVLVRQQSGSDQNDTSIIQKVTEILAPYDEELEVKPYETACDGCQNGKMKNGVDCELCQGSSVRLVDWNPHGEWDSWIFGGRYDGLLLGKPYYTGSIRPGTPDSDRQKQRIDDWEQRFIDNCISIDQLIEQIDPFIPYAIVSQNGWYERGKLGEEEWSKQALQFLIQHPKHWAVLCDLHC